MDKYYECAQTVSYPKDLTLSLAGFWPLDDDDAGNGDDVDIILTALLNQVL